jgi:hypothetical protein
VTVNECLVLGRPLDEAAPFFRILFRPQHLADIASTGFSGAESACVKIGDAVVVYAQGPIGLCANAGARLTGASLVIGVDGDPNRPGSQRFGLEGD